MDSQKEDGDDSQPPQKRCPSESESLGEESEEEKGRPLKKARYVWQIKGKSYLRRNSQLGSLCSTSVNNGSSVSGLSDTDTDNDSDPDDMMTEEVKEQKKSDTQFTRMKTKNPDFLKLRTQHCTDYEASVPDMENCVNDARRPSLEATNNATSDFTQTPENIFSSQSPGHMIAQCFETFLNSLNRANYNLRKWQTKQIAKGIIDNAINKVLEGMGLIPLPVEVDCQTAEGRDRDLNISTANLESEAVSVAIQSQGLHRGASHSPDGSSFYLSDSDSNNNEDIDLGGSNNNNSECNVCDKYKMGTVPSEGTVCTCSQRNVLSSSSPIQQHNPVQHQSFLAPEWSRSFHRDSFPYPKELRKPMQCDDEQGGLSKADVYQEQEEEAENENCMGDRKDPSNILEEEKMSINNHDDLLDTALSVAISEKGLGFFSSHGTM